jgi:hypothetical protein
MSSLRSVRQLARELGRDQRLVMGVAVGLKMQPVRTPYVTLVTPEQAALIGETILAWDHQHERTELTS